MKKLDLVGRRFSYLTVISPSGSKKGHTMWICRCDCGREKEVQGSKLLCGGIKSCGCMHFKACVTHGKSETRLYHIWCTMKARCDNPNSLKYHRYGARGISVCDEWRDFCAFYEWAMLNGYRDGLSIDRINNDGDYEPTNCRWATAKEQSRNTSHTKTYSLNGREYTVYELSELSGVSPKLIWSRIHKGWNVEDATYIPKGKYMGGVGRGHTSIRG